MIIDPKYKIEEFTINFNVIEAFDFRDVPNLLLEKDSIGNLYLSYLYNINDESEERIYVQISKERLSEISEKNISIYEAFRRPENKSIYIIEFLIESAKVVSSFLIPDYVFSEINPIPHDYDVEIFKAISIPELDSVELLNYSEKKQKLIFDFYLQSKNLSNNIKPYAFYKVFTPLVEIIKSMLEVDGRNADKYLAFSNFRQKSLGISIEINYSQDFFLYKESEVMETIVQLLNAKDKKDFENLIPKFRNERYIKEYSTIIRTIIDNDANLFTAYANPVTKVIHKSNINREKAEIVKSIINETYETIEDIEDIIGTFLDINISTKEPSFVIQAQEDGLLVKGKFETSITNKVIEDFVNIGKEVYKFTIKTIYQPETVVKSENIKRFMINYEKINSTKD
ncbi:MAG: DUF6575 domain-containing protein [Candidatus Delongbacteria bacterium]